MKYEKLKRRKESRIQRLQNPAKTNMKKSKIAMLTLCGMLACGSAAGGAYALYTGLSTVSENQFTVKAGKLYETDQSKIGAIEEDLWNPELAKAMMPNQEIAKNPKFISNAEYDAWCIMKVAVPTEIMKIGGEDTEKVYDMVTLQGVDTTNWTLLKSLRSSKDGTDSVYYYGYKTTLSKGEETTELFTSIKVPDISELKSNVTDTVNVSVHLIQSVGFDSIHDAFDILGVQ